MPKPPVIEERQIRHALKVATVTGQNSKRDVALLLVAYGTGLTLHEIAKLLVCDYLQANGVPCIGAVVRPEMAFNGKARPLLWASVKVRGAIDKYLKRRLAFRQGITCRVPGTDHQSPLFLTEEGKPFRGRGHQPFVRASTLN